ncbi:MAG: hypothetical protein HFACDABA_00258 [Anaerolineales bacterium]|nr:hypothetical protein [Anaerolineales bacterium]
MPNLQPDPTSKDSLDRVVYIEHMDAESVQAASVTMRQANADHVSADEVTMNLSAAGGVNAATFSAQQSMIGGANAEEIHVWNSAVGGVNGTLVNVQGTVAGVAGQSITVEGARVGLAAAQEIRGGRVETVVLLAGRVEGEVHAVVDTRGAIIAGLVGGLFAGLVLLVGRIAFRRE